MARSRIKRAGIGCGSILLLLVVLFFALPTRKIVFRKHYDVVSIQQDARYHDAARIARAHASASAYALPPIYQPNGSICGPTSLANVFRSFGEATATPESVVAGSGKCSFRGLCFMGLSLEELAAVARLHPGYRVSVIRDLTLTDFRGHLAQTSDPKRRYIVNFDRGPLFGTEGGHHSPIGGYLADEDLVLVLDVNAKYEPWLVPTERLFAALDTIDGSTEKKRGLLLVERD